MYETSVENFVVFRMKFSVKRLIAIVRMFVTFFEKEYLQNPCCCVRIQNGAVFEKIDRLIFLKEKHPTITETVTGIWYTKNIT